MLFNSEVYIFYFLPVTLLGYFVLSATGKTTASKVWLVAASLFFYGYWKVEYLTLLLSSVGVNYLLGQRIITAKSAGQSKAALVIGIVFNLALLGYFKYANFVFENVLYVAGQTFEPLDIILPLAISFFTFQQIAYLADCHAGNGGRYTLLDYLLFVCFFPQLIAGPIVHHREMMPQFADHKNRHLNPANLATGLFIFSLGLFKKVAIADTFAIWANRGFDSDMVLTFFDAWGVSLSYSFQLYYDFSGYTDMAIGAALMFNIRLPRNFNSPYKAADIQDFWRRWHMTLSRWLRDYVYIPLGGNRLGGLRTAINLFLTFVIGGIWHGAGWTFVIWGMLHGAALIVHRLWTQAGLKMHRLLGWAVTFLFVNFTWVFFRATELDDARRVLSGMIGLNGVNVSADFVVLLTTLYDIPGQLVTASSGEFASSLLALQFILVFGAVAVLARNSMQMAGYTPAGSAPGPDHVVRDGRRTFGQGALAGAAIFVVLFLSTGDTVTTEFLYFNF